MKLSLLPCFLALAIWCAAPSYAQRQTQSQPQTQPETPPVQQNAPAVNDTQSVNIDANTVLNTLRQLNLCRTERRLIGEIKIMVAFSADDDGSRATATALRGRAIAPALYGAGLRPYRPLAPYLSSAAGQDYVLELIRRTNRVLANSNASFRLSETDVAYDLIRDTRLNNGDDGEYMALAFRTRKLNDPRYANRMIMSMAWGPDTLATGPRGGGFADVNDWQINMPSRVFGGTRWEGQDVWGWNMLAHEMGHFLGLQHTFYDDFRGFYEGLASGYRGVYVAGATPDGPQYGWTTIGAGQQFGAQSPSAQLTADRAFITNLLNGQPYGDTDVGDFPRTIQLNVALSFDYSVAGVSDTPPDLGLGWAAANNRNPCAAYAAEINGQTYTNITNRTNPMSYTVCAVEGLRYMPGQVAVMEATLALPHRRYFVTQREMNVQVCTPASSRVGTQ